MTSKMSGDNADGFSIGVISIVRENIAESSGKKDPPDCLHAFEFP
jgi:hypothetical protein